MYFPLSYEKIAHVAVRFGLLGPEGLDAPGRLDASGRLERGGVADLFNMSIKRSACSWIIRVFVYICGPVQIDTNDHLKILDPGRFQAKKRAAVCSSFCFGPFGGPGKNTAGPKTADDGPSASRPVAGFLCGSVAAYFCGLLLRLTVARPRPCRRGRRRRRDGR